MEEVEHKFTPWGDFLASMADLGAADHIWAVIDYCARHGGVYVDSNRCLIMRPVDSSVSIDVLNAFEDVGDETLKHDAWFIIYASGDMKRFFELAPYELPRLIWQRNGRGLARIYDFKRIKSKVSSL